MAITKHAGSVSLLSSGPLFLEGRVIDFSFPESLPLVNCALVSIKKGSL